jgi:hypothetical protein
MATNIFQDPTKALPKKDEQIVRVGFEQQDLGWRTSHSPSNPKSGQLALQHVPNAGSKH